MNLFSGITGAIDWGFSAADIFTNGMYLVGSVASFVLLGLAIKYVPSLIGIIRKAVSPGGKA